MTRWSARATAGLLLVLSLTACGSLDSREDSRETLTRTGAAARAIDTRPVPTTAVCPAESVTPAGTCALTLEAAIRLALARNVDLYNRRQTRQEEQLQLAIDENPWRPEFTASSSTTARAGDVSGSLDLTTTIRVPSGGTASLTLTQPLYGDDGASQSLSFRQPLFQRPVGDSAVTEDAFADLEFPDSAFARDVSLKRLTEQRNSLAFRDSVATLVHDVIQAYRGLSAAQRQVEISAESLQRARDQRTRTAALIEAGRVAARELARADSAIANADLALERARTAETQAQTRLRDLLEWEETLRIRPVTTPGAEEEDAGGDAAVAIPDPEEVLARRTDYLSAVIATTQAQETLAQEEANLLPDVNLTFTVPFGADPSLGIGATFPLSNRRQRELDLLKARNALAQAERARDKTRTRIRREVERAVQDIAVNRRLETLARTARELAARNLEIAEFRFAQGLTAAVDLTRATQELARAAEAEQEARLATRTARDALDRAAGRTLERWGIAVEALDP